MKKISFSRKQILRAVHAACIAFFFAASAARAGAAPTNSVEFTVNGSTVTVAGSANNTTSAYFTDGSPNSYAMTIQSGANLGNTSTNLIVFGAGSITNAGTLNSIEDAIWLQNGSLAPVTVTNTGTITGSNSAVYIQGDGTINNNAGGTISGKYPVYISGAGTVNNDGSISSTSTYAVYVGTGTVNNSGTITSSVSYGVFINGNGTVNNTATGTISGSTSTGSESGVYIDGTGTVHNAGSISGNYSGVYISEDGTVTNSSTGSITSSGNYAGVHINGVGTVTNSGYIAAFDGGSGIYLGDGGTVTNTSSGYIFSEDGNGINMRGDGTVNNDGGIVSDDADGIRIRGDATINNTGTISGYDHGLNIRYDATVTNSGSISGYNDQGIYIGGNGTINNSGTISSYYDQGVHISGNGTISNTGTISAQYADGVYIGGNGTVNNYGTISCNYNNENGSTVYGVYIDGDGTINNSGTMSGSSYSGSGYGVEINGNGTVVNSGTMSGSSYDGDYAVGLEVNGVANITNTGTGNISGSGYSASAYGIYTGDAGSKIVNSGTISAYSRWDTAYGIYMDGDNSSLVTKGGSISAYSFDSDAFAVYLAGSNSSVTVQGRTNIQGVIEGNENTGNVLNLNLVGMTPAQATAFKAYVATHTDSGSYTFANSGYNYTWDGFGEGAVTAKAISLETVVDSGLQDLAVKIDNNPNALPSSLDELFAAAAVDPEAALNTFTGREFLNAFTQQGLSETAALSEIADQRAFDLRAGSGGLDFAGLNVQSGSMIASLGNTENILSRLTSSAFGGTTMSDSKQALEVNPASSSPLAAWVAGSVTIADEDNTSTNPGYTATSGSPSIGFDYRINRDIVLGALFNFTTAGANFSDGSRVDSTSELIGVYADWAHDHWFVNALAAGGFSNFDQSRITMAPGSGPAQASPDGTQEMVNVTSGYDFKVSGFVLSPEVGLLYTHLNKDSFTESGAGAFDLNVGEQDVDSLRTKLGFHASRPFTWDAIKFNPEIHATWYHECLDDTNDVSNSIAGAPAFGSFLVSTNPQGRDFAVVGAGLTATPSEWHDNVSFYLDYDAQAGQTNYVSHTINGGIRVNF